MSEEEQPKKTPEPQIIAEPMFQAVRITDEDGKVYTFTHIGLPQVQPGVNVMIKNVEITSPVPLSSVEKAMEKNQKKAGK